VRTRAVAIVLVALGAVAGCSSSDDTKSSPTATTSTTETPAKSARNVAEAAAYDPHLSTFATTLNLAGLAATLGGDAQFTVFAPTNDAFSALPHNRLTALMSRAGKQELAKIVGGHVVKGKIQAKDLAPGPLTALNGATLTLTESAGKFTIADGEGNRATIEPDPLVVPNGVVYRVDGLLARRT
jgi:uncharacterized surface protein with fasciclin (FAS1) repeats